MTEVIKRPGFYLEDGIEYPESDGKPMADNTLQFQWIVTIKGGLDDMFRDNPLVFIAGDLLWYPIKGRNDLVVAPDAMVVFGRPSGYRGSYRQWQEDDIPPQVVFEVLSPNNTKKEMRAKHEFYERHGVEEYYLYDPGRMKLEGWQRQGDRLVPIHPIAGWVSPRLQIRFEFSGAGGELEIFRPNGERFLTFLESHEQKRQAQRQADLERIAKLHAQQQAELERTSKLHAQERANLAEQQAEQERSANLQAQEQTNLARQQIEQEQTAKEQERLAKERAWAKLRELGIDPENLK